MGWRPRRTFSAVWVQMTSDGLTISPARSLTAADWLCFPECGSRRTLTWCVVDMVTWSLWRCCRSRPRMEHRLCCWCVLLEATNGESNHHFGQQSGGLADSPTWKCDPFTHTAGADWHAVVTSVVCTVEAALARTHPVLLTRALLFNLLVLTWKRQTPSLDVEL